MNGGEADGSERRRIARTKLVLVLVCVSCPKRITYAVERIVIWHSLSSPSCSIRRARGMLAGAPPGEVKKGIPPQILKNLGVEVPYLDLARSFANPAGTARFVTQLHPRQLVEEAVLFRLICEDSVRGGQGGACIQKRDPVLAQNIDELWPPTQRPQTRNSK